MFLFVFCKWHRNIQKRVCLKLAYHIARSSQVHFSVGERPIYLRICNEFQYTEILRGPSHVGWRDSMNNDICQAESWQKPIHGVPSTPYCFLVFGRWHFRLATVWGIWWWHELNLSNRYILRLEGSRFVNNAGMSQHS